MSFGLKNAPPRFSRIVVDAFKDFIQKFVEVYMVNLTIYGMVKNHIMNLQLMLERCRKQQISLNLKNCIFCAPFGIFLGHIVCKEDMLFDYANIMVIVDFLAPKRVKQLRATLGHIGYQR